jgi:hypothetical protein
MLLLNMSMRVEHSKEILWFNFLMTASNLSLKMLVEFGWTINSFLQEDLKDTPTTFLRQTAR